VKGECLMNINFLSTRRRGKREEDDEQQPETDSFHEHAMRIESVGVSRKL